MFNLDYIVWNTWNLRCRFSDHHLEFKKPWTHVLNCTAWKVRNLVIRNPNPQPNDPSFCWSKNSWIKEINNSLYKVRINQKIKVKIRLPLKITVSKIRIKTLLNDSDAIHHKHDIKLRHDKNDARISKGKVLIWELNFHSQNLFFYL